MKHRRRFYVPQFLREYVDVPVYRPRHRADSYVWATADACTVYEQHIMVNKGRRDELAADMFQCKCGKTAIQNKDEDKAKHALVLDTLPADRKWPWLV